MNVAGTQLPACSGDEICDAVLRLQAFIEMFVARQHDADVVLDEQGLQLFAQVERGSMRAARGIQRMMEECDLPVGA